MVAWGWVVEHLRNAPWRTRSAKTIRTSSGRTSPASPSSPAGPPAGRQRGHRRADPAGEGSPHEREDEAPPVDGLVKPRCVLVPANGAYAAQRHRSLARQRLWGGFQHLIRGGGRCWAGHRDRSAVEHPGPDGCPHDDPSGRSACQYRCVVSLLAMTTRPVALVTDCLVEVTLLRCGDSES